MTLNEAKQVAAIISEADNGCSVCVNNLVDLANKTFPKFLFHEYDYDGPVKVELRKKKK